MKSLYLTGYKADIAVARDSNSNVMRVVAFGAGTQKPLDDALKQCQRYQDINASAQLSELPQH